MYDSESRCWAVTEDNRGFDDHMNFKATPFPSAPNIRIGEPIGSQPSYGFTSYLDLKEEIESITACLGSRAGTFAESSSHDIVGLKVSYRRKSISSALLGSCTVFGPTIEFSQSDDIVKVQVGLSSGSHPGEPRSLNQILFTTRKGTVKGFRDDKVIDSSTSSNDQVVLNSSDCLELIGLTWSFDLTHSSAADHAIAPVYTIKQEPEDSYTSYANTKIQGTLYPSHSWMHPISACMQPRPIPAKEGYYSPLAPVLLPSTCSLVSIRVFFNNFLQGFSFTLSNDETHSVGNLLGAFQDFSIDRNERVYSISFFQRQQTTIRTQVPGDILSVEGVRFSVCTWVDGVVHARHSPYFGPLKAFGPFLNEQRGLWNANWGGSAGWAGCFPRKTTSINIQPGTSFAGMYVEFSSTHIRRAGALVSDEEGLPEDVEPLFSRQLSETANLVMKGSPSEYRIEEAIPYLGDPPLASSTMLPVVGRAVGSYRVWCPAPSSLCKIITYRHSTGGGPVILGLEFVSRDQSSHGMLLGHRTLWMEHAIETDVEEGAEVKGFEIKGQHETGKGVEEINVSRAIIQVETPLLKRKQQFIIGKVHLDRTLKENERHKKPVGYYAYIGVSHAPTCSSRMMHR